VPLPEVEEGTHFRLPSFTVNGKSFVVVEKGDASVLLSVDRGTAEEAAAREPHVYEVVWREAIRLRRRPGRSRSSQP
jgi:hypothetical protein